MEIKPCSELPLERLEHEISTLAAHIYAATCRWLLLIAEFDRRQGWQTWGMTSCPEWLAFKCSLSPRSARDHVRVAHTIEDLPHIRDAFAAGELSYSKVRALTRIATAETDADLAGIGRHCTAAQLDRLVRAYARGTVEDANELAERRFRDRFVSWSYDEYGMVRIEARLDPAEGMTFVKAMEAALDAEPGGSAEPEAESFSHRAADALVHISETYLRAGPQTGKGGDRYLVVLHADQGTLSNPAVPRNRCHLDDGPSLAPETLRRLACDCSLVEVVDDEDLENGGRKTRTIPAATRRVVRIRDEGRCTWPGCERKAWLDCHHIVFWAEGGEHEASNLVLLCRKHHRAVHEGRFSVRKDQEGITFLRPDGTELPKSASLKKAGRSLEGRNRSLGVIPDGETCMTLSFEPVDYSDLVYGLRSTERFRPDLN